MPRGEIFILSSPSGTGKNTLIRRVLTDLDGLEHSISHTTRPARQGEIDGTDYHFVDRPTFEAMIETDAFLEWAEYNGNYYGTSSAQIESRLERGADVILDIEIQGTVHLLKRRPEAHAVFLLPPSYEELRQRIVQRGLDGPDAVAQRLEVSLWEIERYGLYHYAIINDDLERASQALAAIILDKRHRVARQEESVKQVLADFRRFSEPG